MLKGARETTWNSSGERLVRPSTSLALVQPATAGASTASAKGRQNKDRRMVPNLLGMLRFSAIDPVKQPVEEQQRHPDEDAGIGQIERRPVPFAATPGLNVEIQEIEHRAEPDSVDHISERAAGNQADSDGGQPVPDPGQPINQPERNQDG